MDTYQQYKKLVRDTFDQVSNNYDGNRFFKISASNVANMIPSGEKLKILDLSTGTGAIALAIAEKHKHVSIEAVDLSPGMLQVAEAKAQEKGLTNITFRQCDVDNLVYDNATFDIVTCGYALTFYPDLEAAYQAICKIIKPGGMFIFSTLAEKSFTPHSEFLRKRLEDDYNVVIPESIKVGIKTKERIEEMAATCRHNGINVIFEPIRYPISVSEWWFMLNSVGFKLLIDQLSDKQRQELKERHIQELEELSDDGMIELNVDTLYGVVNL